MIHLLERWLRRVRRAGSFSYWRACWRGRNQAAAAGRPGLLLIQVDGLSYRQLQRALETERMPFLQRLLQADGFAVRPLYSGLPSTTPAVQGELFYGVPGAVPAFAFRYGATVENMLSRTVADAVEKDLSTRTDEPLLRDGSSWSNIFSGGATPEESHFCPAASNLPELLAVRPWYGVFGLALFAPVLWIKLPLMLAWELLVALWDALLGIRAGEPVREELRFVLSRLLVGTALREGITAGAAIDLIRGLPAVHVNFLGYDERGHRRGPGSHFAHSALPGIDGCIRKLVRSAVNSPGRDYEICILADHGQETVRSYFQERGPIEEALKLGLAQVCGTSAPPFEVAASGPVGHVYPAARLGEVRCRALAEWLVHSRHVPGVLFVGEHGEVVWLHRGGETPLEAAEAILPHDAVLRRWIIDDLGRLTQHPCAGELVLLGWEPGGDSWSFSLERGAHGGPGPEETSGFVLGPQSLLFQTGRSETAVRPMQLRSMALQVMGRKRRQRHPVPPPVPTRPLRVMTYNVHSCIGMDGRVSPARIAQVLSRYDPDVVALQELDAGHARTGGDDQVQLIAEDLGFESLFCPTVCSGRAQYGIAVLSRYPLHLLNMARLPTGPKQACEPRAAMLASLRFGSDEIYVLNTHFGLGWSERAAQAAEILTDAWIGRFPEDAPLIVCGDFNMRPHSVTYRCLTKRLADVQAAAVKPSSANTFPSLWPVARIDHIFVSRGFRVAQARVPRSELTRVASDHLPLVADLEWPGELRQEKLGKPGSQALVDRP